MKPKALLPLRRKACWGFFRPKNPTASAGFEPAKFCTKGQHATPRPPKPIRVYIYAFICVYTNFNMLMCIHWCYYCIYSNNALIMDHIMDMRNIFLSCSWILDSYISTYCMKAMEYFRFIHSVQWDILLIRSQHLHNTNVYNVVYITIWEYVSETVLRSVGCVYGNYGIFFFFFIFRNFS